MRLNSSEGNIRLDPKFPNELLGETEDCQLRTNGERKLQSSYGNFLIFKNSAKLVLDPGTQGTRDRSNK